MICLPGCSSTDRVVRGGIQKALLTLPTQLVPRDTRVRRLQTPRVCAYLVKLFLVNASIISFCTFIITGACFLYSMVNSPAESATS